MRTEINAANQTDLRYKKQSRCKMNDARKLFVTNIWADKEEDKEDEKQLFYAMFKNCSTKFTNDQKRIIKRYQQQLRFRNIHKKQINHF